jgi:serine/threonine protein kinase
MNDNDSRDESRDNSQAGPHDPTEDQPIRLGGYDLLREIGHGGQATIFVATQRSTGRKVAVKLMYGGRVASAVERGRLDQEVRILAALDHPNIVSVIDRGQTEDGSIYFVMPYVHGQTLNEYLDNFHRENGPPERVADLAPLLKTFVRICEAVNAAHLRGVVHRDLKPSNVVVDAYGEPHILDFGLARSPIPFSRDDGSSNPTTQTGEFVGSLHWASPEQAEGATAQIDIRSDVYSLGVILYEMITGDFPYDVFGSLREALNNIVHTEPLPPSQAIRERLPADPAAAAAWVNPVDDLLDVIVLKALKKKPEDRYQSAGEFSKAISYYVSGYETQPRRAPAPAPVAHAPKKRSFAVPAIAATVVVLGLGAWLALHHGSRPPAPPAQETEGVGYRTETGDVVFEFAPDEYDNVRLPDGRFDRLTAGGPVRKVIVAGDFNAWARGGGDWTLKKEPDGVFRLRCPLTMFAARHVWPFKFVVNGDLWVGAPHHAPNREIVVTDASTYNLLLYNPAVAPDDGVRETIACRERIDQAWQGLGANLTRDQTGGYHFVFNYLPANFRLGSLDPLAGIPLVSLDLGDTRVTDMGPLRDMTSLQVLVLNDVTYDVLTKETIAAIQGGAWERARAAAREALGGYAQVPALAAALRLLTDGIDLMANAQPAATREFKSHRYAYVPLPMLWSEARDFATARGAHLATVSDAEEQAWLTATFGLPSLGRRIWLGASDEANEGFWRWSNGDRWSFENWDRPEPSNDRGAEHCLAMKFDGWWTDNDGGLRMPSIIEWEP